MQIFPYSPRIQRFLRRKKKWKTLQSKLQKMVLRCTHNCEKGKKILLPGKSQLNENEEYRKIKCTRESCFFLGFFFCVKRCSLSLNKRTLKTSAYNYIHTHYKVKDGYVCVMENMVWFWMYSCGWIHKRVETPYPW